MKPLVYPFTFEQWLKHPNTKPKLKWCKKVGDRLDAERKYGTQTELQL